MPQSYSQKSIVEWFRRTMGIESMPSPYEIKTSCPACGADVFYFNIRKKVGICHKASCGFTPNIDSLIELIGFGPDVAGVWEPPEEQAPAPVVVPGVPILKMENAELLTSNDEALAYLRGRGISDMVILNWGLTCDGNRVYVPIRSEGATVNFNSRLLPGREGKKYLYSPGAKTGHYILGWEECKDWPYLTLVENTFVSLAMRNLINCSTCFGSNVSDIQTDLISRSTTINWVGLLWDQGAEKNANRSVNKLIANGVKAAYWKILGQPDDYPITQVVEWAGRVMDAAYNGVPFVDLRKECEECLTESL